MPGFIVDIDAELQSVRATFRSKQLYLQPKTVYDELCHDHEIGFRILA